MREKLCGTTLSVTKIVCVTKFCVKKNVGEKIVWNNVVCDKNCVCDKVLCEKLCVKKLCGTTLSVTKIVCVTKFCMTKLCAAAGGGSRRRWRGRETEPKTRTPNKNVVKNNFAPGHEVPCLPREMH